MDPRVKHEDDKRIGGAACALNAGPGTKCRDDNLELKALRRSAAGDAHVAGDGRLLAAAVDDEVVALGLEADGLEDGGVEPIGRAVCRGRVYMDEEVSGGGVHLKKKT